MSGPIYFRRGLQAGLPVLDNGEPAWCTNTKKLYVGQDGTNTLINPDAGTGTVTSVGLSLPASVFSVAGSPVTTTGTLAGTFASQSPNLVLASPDGSSGTPSFRALTAGDIPGGTGGGDQDAKIMIWMGW